jgi:hypothetical protein
MRRMSWSTPVVAFIFREIDCKVFLQPKDIFCCHFCGENMALNVYSQFLFCTLLSIASVHAAPEFVSIQEKAQGQSLTGATLLNDSIFGNPASSAFIQAYAVDGSFLPPKSFSASVLDTKTSAVAGGLGYFRREVADQANVFQGLRLSLSGRVSNVIGIGMAGKVLWGPGSTGQNGRLNDGDIGTIANLGFVQFGMTTRNILGGNKQMGYEREVAVGGRINYEGLLYFSAAAHSKVNELNNPYQYGVGAEYVTPYYVSAKGGYRMVPSSRQNYWSAGASFISPALSLHYAVEIPTAENDVLGKKNKPEHQFGATMQF